MTMMSTEADRLVSVAKIRDALKDLSARTEPFDLMVVTGDGSLDHHVLIAAFWAFYPDKVQYREGKIDCSSVGSEDLESLPRNLSKSLFSDAA